MEVAMAEPGEILPERNVDMPALYDMLREAKASTEETVAKMLAIKKEGQPKSQLRELITQVLLNFIKLRQANRSILLEEDRAKAETERTKAPVDLITLQLHNLMYEKNHYVKAIKACKDFKTKYPDIELVPEEEFLRDAPEDIKSPTFSADSSHDLMLKRLNYELFQRKELCKLREELEQQKNSLQDTIANRRKFLSSLPSHLKSLKKASLPVQQHLGFMHTKKLKQHQLAELLPPPLYIIYSQLLAQKEAFGENIELEIVGSVKDAQTFARQLANKDSALSAQLDISKMEEDVLDEEDDEQRRRKRHKKMPSKEKLDQFGIYQGHPLKVILDINDDQNAGGATRKLISLKFEFLYKLNIICVEVDGFNGASHGDTLCNLFPDDTGLELPQQAVKLCVGDSVLFDETRTSRPYKWAQHLAGIDFLPEVSPLVSSTVETNGVNSKQSFILSGLSLYRQQNRVQTVVQRIRDRMKAHMALEQILDLVKKLNWPRLISDGVPWASHRPLCSFYGWYPVSSTGSSGIASVNARLSQGKDSQSSRTNVKAVTSVDEIESVKEDGELPSLATTVNEVTVFPSDESDLEQSREVNLISRSIMSPISKGKSPSFKKMDEDVELIQLSDSEVDEPVQVEESSEILSTVGNLGTSSSSWADCGIQEYILVLTQKLANDDRTMKLEAKVKLTPEYPLRPPHFSLNLHSSSGGDNHFNAINSEFFNELRALESEVNCHLIRLIPYAEENLVLAHQVLFLATLFDFFLDDTVMSSDKKPASKIDIGLRSSPFRGRDHKKMISWEAASNPR